MPSRIFNYFSLLFFAIIASLSGCAQAPEDSGLPRIKIPDRTDADLYLTDMAESVQRVQLETNEDVLLGHIKNVALRQGNLYVEDGYGIYVFDTEGALIQKVGKKGEGPGEFKYVTFMDIDEQTGNIYVSGYSKLIVYNKDGEFVEERKLGFLKQFLKVLDGRLFVMSEQIGIEVPGGYANQTNLYEVNPSSLEVMDTIPVRTVLLDKKEFGFFPFRDYFSNLEEGLFLYAPVLSSENMLRDTLYRVQDRKLEPYMRFDFERPQSLNEQGRQTILLYNIINSPSYMIAEYDQDWQRMMFLYDKKNEKGYNLSKGLIDEDGEPVFLRPLDLKNDAFYFIKRVEYADKDIEELNPEIGIVKLK
jgi:hypothetical protein